MRLEEIGFYTLSDARAAQSGVASPLWRGEIILTDKCNFSCPYCRGIEDNHQGDLSKTQASSLIDLWASHGLKNIRFSGGEPTVWPGLLDLVEHARASGIERIALSTNGSLATKFYDKLISSGVNDFSISLDACCAATGDAMAGLSGAWQKVIDNIAHISKQTYVTVGVVLTPENVREFQEIISLASDVLGVDDIRIVSSAQWNESFKDISVDNRYLQKHPILSYRIKNYQSGRNIRGLCSTDTTKCPLVLDDLAYLDGLHYPCIIYMRERGNPIGKMGSHFRRQRLDWFMRHNTHQDEICKKNCLDVCIDYNNRAMAINPSLNKNFFKKIIKIKQI